MSWLSSLNASLGCSPYLFELLCSCSLKMWGGGGGGEQKIDFVGEIMYF